MGIGFESKKKAEDEIKLLKKADRKNKLFYGFIKRIRYRVIIRRAMTTIKKADSN